MMKSGGFIKFMANNWEGISIIVIFISVMFMYGIMKENDVSELDKKTMDASISLKTGDVTIEGMEKSPFLVDEGEYYKSE